MSMRNSTRNIVRHGWKGCKCCDRVPSSRTTRTREKRAVVAEVNGLDRAWTEDEQVSVFGKVVATF